MYGFPEVLPIDSIVGYDLNLMGLGWGDVQLNFTGSGVLIQVFGDMTLIKQGCVVAEWDDKRNWTSLDFQELLNATVDSFHVKSKQLLEITFSNGLVLQIHDNNPRYEAVTITIEDTRQMFIV
jgi:hypothetical protein